jgi:hypothetical protein
MLAVEMQNSGPMFCNLFYHKLEIVIDGSAGGIKLDPSDVTSDEIDKLQCRRTFYVVVFPF